MAAPFDTRRGWISRALPLIAAGLLLAAFTLSIQAVRAIKVNRTAERAALHLQADLNYLEALEEASHHGQHVDATEANALAESIRLSLAELVASSDTAVDPAFAQRIERFTDHASHQTTTTGPDALEPGTHELFLRISDELEVFDAEVERASDDAMASATSRLRAAGLLTLLAGIAAFLSEGRRQRDRTIALADERARVFYQTLFEASAEHTYVADADGRVLYQSPTAIKTNGGPITQLQQLLPLLRPPDARAAEEAFDNGTTGDRPMLVEIPGDPVRWAEFTIRNELETEGIEALILTSRDVTERTTLEQELSRQALEDQLTCLPNRRALQARYQQAVVAGQRQPHATVLLLIDLDGFKGVNDTLGHPVGDRLLQQVGDRLRATTRSGELVARLGGDEFAVLLEQVPGDREALAAASRFLEALRLPYVLDGTTTLVRASLGLAIGRDGGDFDDIFRHADIALYEAKHRGRNRVVCFTASMERSLFEQSRLQRAMDDAFVRGEFRLVYQPLYRVTDRHLDGFEALMRWRSPTMGDVSPMTFIPAAEDSGLILQLGRWALEQACDDLARWNRRRPDDPITMSVNVSIIQFDQTDFIEHLEATMAASGIDPWTLQLEITESVLAENQERLVTVLSAVRALGVHVALDDFGKGYSSMGQLQQLPVDCIKIDRSFISPMCDTDPGAVSVVHALVELGRALGLSVVAEGVETEAQLSALAVPGCDLAQGYLLSRPLEVADARDLPTTGPGPDATKAAPVVTH